MSYSDVQKRAWFEIKQIYLHVFLFDYLVAKVKMKQCLLGFSRLNGGDGVCMLVESWRLEVGS